MSALAQSDAVVRIGSNILNAQKRYAEAAMVRSEPEIAVEAVLQSTIKTLASYYVYGQLTLDEFEELLERQLRSERISA